MPQVSRGERESSEDQEKVGGTIALLPKGSLEAFGPHTLKPPHLRQLGWQPALAAKAASWRLAPRLGSLASQLAHTRIASPHAQPASACVLLASHACWPHCPSHHSHTPIAHTH